MTPFAPVLRRPRGVALLVALTLAGPVRSAAQEGARAPSVDISGDWILEVVSPNGVGTREVTFVQDGDSITGKIASSMASGSLEGTIEGNEVSFVARVSMDTGSFPILYRATLVDGEMKDGTVEFGSYGSGTFTGRRKDPGGNQAGRPPHGMSTPVRVGFRM